MSPAQLKPAQFCIWTPGFCHIQMAYQRMFMHTGYIDFPRRSLVPTAEMTLQQCLRTRRQHFCLSKQCLLSLLFAVLVLLQIGYLGIIFPQREFIVCKMKFYSRAQKSRCKRFQKTLVSRYQVNTLLGCSPLKCHKSWDQDVIGSRRFPPQTTKSYYLGELIQLLDSMEWSFQSLHSIESHQLISCSNLLKIPSCVSSSILLQG